MVRRIVILALASALAVATPNWGLAQTPATPTLTLAELQRLSLQDGAKRVLAAVGGRWAGVEGAAISHPRLPRFPPPPPYMNLVWIDLPVQPAERGDVCVKETLVVQFQRLAKSLVGGTYDPTDSPAVVIGETSDNLYADADDGKGGTLVDCKTLDAKSYFPALDKTSAFTAIRAFRLFGDAVSKQPGSSLFRCKVILQGFGSCQDFAAQLRAIQHIYDLNGMVTEMTGLDQWDTTIVLRVESRSGGRLAELRLVMRRDARAERLISAVLTHTPPPPPT